MLEELRTKYYEKKTDLLGTIVVWGMVAPIVFVLKIDGDWLELIHLYGFSNAGKTSTGKIILAFDGHHNDKKYKLHFSRINSEARLGNAISKSTFPILVNEVDLTNEKNRWLVDALKSVVEDWIARTKYTANRTSTEDIPSLTCLIFTSNPPPPTHDSAYMRRSITRNFTQGESHKENDPESIEFERFLHTNLSRLKGLGDFRNWYIINHQDEFLNNENRPEPLDLGLNILKAAFDYAGLEIPKWLLEDRIHQNQLEESMQDNDVIIKNAFEKYIREQVNNAIPIWRTRLQRDEKGHVIEDVDIPDDISDRLEKLAVDNLTPCVKYSKINREFIISTGILAELYNHGVTKSQLPNLKAFADYIGLDYRKSDGKMVAAGDLAKLTKYFDEMEDNKE